MTLKGILKAKWCEFVYLLFSAVFLFKLRRLNDILLGKGLDQRPFELLAYDNYKPLQYFILAMILFFAGSVLIMINFRSIRDEDLEFEDIVISAVAMLIIVFMLISLFIYINNPIARAVLTVAAIGGVISISNK